MPTLASYYAELGVKGLPQVLGAFASVRGGLQGLASAAVAPITGLSSSLTALVSPANLVATALGALGVAGGGGILKLAANAETLAMQFRVLLGSGKAAAQMIRQINEFAPKTPFEQQELGAAAKQLLAYGTSADQVLPILRQLGDIAAVSGASLAELVPIYGKIQAQGRLTAETLESWQARGIRIARELAKTLGVAESEIRDLVSEGKVGFPEVQAAIAALTSAGGEYAGGMAQLSQTTAGLWSTVTGNLKTLLATFGEALIEGLGIKTLLSDLGAWLDRAKASAGGLAGIVSSTFRTWWSVLEPVWNGLRGIVDLAWSIGETFTALPVVPALQSIGEAIGSVAGLIVDLGNVVWTVIGPVVQLFGSALVAAIRVVADMVSRLVDGLRSVLRWLELIADGAQKVAGKVRGVLRWLGLIADEAQKTSVTPAAKATPEPGPVATGPAAAAPGRAGTAAPATVKVPAFEGLTDLYKRISTAAATSEAQRTAAATERTAKAAERTADTLDRLASRPAPTQPAMPTTAYAVLAPR